MVQRLVFRVRGFECMTEDLGYNDEGAGFKAQDSRLKVRNT
jgi:hypothetical protein